MKRSATPILDLQRSVPLPQDGITPGGLLKAVPAALGLIALFALVMVLLFTHQTHIPSWLATLGVSIGGIMETIFSNGVVVAVVVPLGVPFLATLIHEVGHATAALALRWPVQEFRIVPFSLAKAKDGWKLNVSWNLKPQALVIAEPLPFARYHVKQSVLAFGGPAANLLSCVLVVLLDPGPHAPLGHAICWFFLAWSGFLGFVNLLPIHTRGLELDGYSVFLVGRNRQALAVRIASLRLHDHVVSGMSASSCNRRWLALTESSGKASQYNRVGLWLAYAYWSEQRQFDRAARLLEKMLRGCEGNDMAFRALLFAECAVFWAMRGNSEAALAWNQRTKDLFLPDYLRYRANSYVAWSRGDLREALKEAIASRDATRTLGSDGRQEYLSSWEGWIETIRMKSQPEVAEAGTVHPA